jgi:hypothetical protein
MQQGARFQHPKPPSHFECQLGGDKNDSRPFWTYESENQPKERLTLYVKVDSFGVLFSFVTALLEAADATLEPGSGAGGLTLSKLPRVEVDDSEPPVPSTTTTSDSAKEVEAVSVGIAGEHVDEATASVSTSEPRSEMFDILSSGFWTADDSGALLK